MQYVPIVVVAVGLLCLLDLLLTFGVIRRLRLHSELLSRRSPLAGDEAVPVGSPPMPFETTTTDGQRVSAETMPARTIVAFFTPDCSPCREQLPVFVDKATEFVQNGAHVLAVVVGDTDAGAEMVGQLERVGPVVAEPMGGPVSAAFRLRGYPSMCVLDERGIVSVSGRDINQLLVPAMVER